MGPFRDINDPKLITVLVSVILLKPIKLKAYTNLCESAAKTEVGNRGIAMIILQGGERL